jgi:hypothetical protein
VKRAAAPVPSCWTVLEPEEPASIVIVPSGVIL